MSPILDRPTADGRGSRSRRPLRDILYREAGAGGFSSVDGSVEFYNRVNSLLDRNMTILDFGAGRGKDATDDPVAYRRSLRTLKGKVRLIIGADIDFSIARNPSLDAAIAVEEWRGLPFASSSIDMVLSDHTLEHIRYPEPVAAELDRILRPAGWICARTPNRWGYIAVGARIVPKSLHHAALRVLQPGRSPSDVFPTSYKLNTFYDLHRHFPPERYSDYSYYYSPEPAYFGDSVAINRIARAALGFLPRRCSPILMVFKQRRA